MIVIIMSKNGTNRYEGESDYLWYVASSSSFTSNCSNSTFVLDKSLVIIVTIVIVLVVA
jgi:hypothetical protein